MRLARLATSAMRKPQSSPPAHPPSQQSTSATTTAASSSSSSSSRNTLLADMAAKRAAKNLSKPKPKPKAPNPKPHFRPNEVIDLLDDDDEFPYSSPSTQDLMSTYSSQAHSPPPIYSSQTKLTFSSTYSSQVPQSHSSTSIPNLPLSYTSNLSYPKKRKNDTASSDKWTCTACTYSNKAKYVQRRFTHKCAFWRDSLANSEQIAHSGRSFSAACVALIARPGLSVQSASLFTLRVWSL